MEQNFDLLYTLQAIATCELVKIKIVHISNKICTPSAIFQGVMNVHFVYNTL